MNPFIFIAVFKALSSPDAALQLEATKKIREILSEDREPILGQMNELTCSIAHNDDVIHPL